MSEHAQDDRGGCFLGCLFGCLLRALLLGGLGLVVALGFAFRWLLAGGRNNVIDTPEHRHHPVQAPPEPAEYEENVVGRPARLPDAEDLAAGYELSDAAIGGALRAGVALLIFSAIAFVVVTAFQALLTGRLDDIAPPEAGVADPPQSDVPYLIETRALTGEEYEQYRTTEDERLGSYGWVDEGAGQVHIPIERAMELMLDAGFPTREGADEASLIGLESPLDSSSGRMMERTREWLDAESPR